jgi:hypothetical protein
MGASSELAKIGCASDAQSAMRSDVPTHEERLEFLRQAIALSEWNIRTLELKAQILIVAFVLSLSPLWSIISSTCSQAASSLMVQVLLALFVATVFLLAFVMLPAVAAQPTQAGAWPKKALFAAGDPNRIAVSAYAGHIESLTSEIELAAETLNLARLRETKSRRFKHALRLAFIFYGWSVAAFLMLRNC